MQTTFVSRVSSNEPHDMAAHFIAGANMNVQVAFVLLGSAKIIMDMMGLTPEEKKVFMTHGDPWEAGPMPGSSLEQFINDPQALHDAFGDIIPRFKKPE